MEFMEKQQIRKLIDEQLLKKYAPAIISPYAIAASLMTSRIIRARMMAALDAQKAAYEKYGTRSNNWLKMHGYPLRRKKAR